MKNHEQGPQQPRVLAVVVGHNGERWIDDCLRSISAQVYPSLRVMVVDSASDHPAEPLVRRHLPRAEYLRLDNDSGFGAAANSGLEASRHAPGADYFLFLHDDVAMEPECLSRLVATAVSTKAALVGGKGLAWDRPEVLVEVGMSADPFCRPVSGLEEGEIDQGQHDHRDDVLFVTSACVLVSREMVARCGSWDGEYFVFGEDLDLCLRAQLVGFKVVVEPGARFRHALALVTGRRTGMTASSKRFYAHRSRYRTIVKNAALHRMVPLVALYFLAGLAEMVTLGTRRRLEEAAAYPRAFWSIVASLPELAHRRRAVQKRRTIPDRGLAWLQMRSAPGPVGPRIFRELHLRESEVQTARLGARTLARLSPSTIRPRISAWAARRENLAAGAILLVLLLAMRATLAGGVAAGGLWPFPEATGRLLGDYLSPWRQVGLGSSVAAPTAFPLLWLFGVLGLGNATLAQVLLVVFLVSAGLMGMARLVARRTQDLPARVVALTIYALSPALRLAVEGGDLGALALYAGLPYMLALGLRMLGTTPSEAGDRPPTALNPDAMGRDALRLALITAGVVALAPSAYPGLVLLWLLAAAFSFSSAPHREQHATRVGWMMGSVGVAALLLIPWSLEALRPQGATLAPLFSGPGGGAMLGALWSGHGFADMLLLDPGGGPGGSTLMRLLSVAVLVGAPALATAPGRREARLLAGIWIGFALVGGLAAGGRSPAPAASPALWMVVPLASLAVSASHLIAGLRRELPRHAFGWRHMAASAVGLAILAGLLGASATSLQGWSRPRPTLAAAGVSPTARSISSFLTSNVREVGDFRVLWVGRSFLDPVRAGAPRVGATPYLLTGPEGLTMRNAQAPAPEMGEKRLQSTLDALAGGRLHLGGHLLSPFGVRFIVVDRADQALMAGVELQRDLALEQQQGNAAIFRNLQWLPRAALLPPELARLARGGLDERALMLANWTGASVAIVGSPSGAALVTGEIPSRPASLVLLADNFNRAWKATAAGDRLPHVEAFGWSNGFELSPGARGEIRMSFPRRSVRLIWVVLQASLLGIAAVLAGRRRPDIAGRSP